MSWWKCSNCGQTKESRCKPKKCPHCKAENSFQKIEDKK